MDPLSLEGKVALITGAGSGIGKASATVLGRHGARIGVLDLDPARVEDVVAHLAGRGVDAEPLVADVSKPDQVEACVKTLVARFGRLDIVFANAGVNGVWAPIEDITPEEFEQTVAINLGGSFYAIKYAVPHLKKNGGNIVLTSSINGTRIFSNTGASPYAASKAGQVALAKMLAVELGQFNIRVNAICPGYMPSNIHEGTVHRNQESIKIKVEYPQGSTPLKHKAEPEQVGDLLLFLVSDMARHITGEVVYIDAGTSLVVG